MAFLTQPCRGRGILSSQRVQFPAAPGVSVSSVDAGTFIFFMVLAVDFALTGLVFSVNYACRQNKRIGLVRAIPRGMAAFLRGPENPGFDDPVFLHSFINKVKT
jgi:hypothetical protein